MTSQAPQSQPPPSSRKGTFTDDLHKLVDNWARDAMNLSGKKSKGHGNYEVSSSVLIPGKTGYLQGKVFSQV